MSHFGAEIREQPTVLTGLLADDTIRTTAEALRERSPSFISTVARGSSANAAAFFAYLAGSSLRLPAGPLPISLFSVHGVSPRAAGGLAVGVSQSGRSADVIAAVRALSEGGALSLGVSNDPESELAAAAGWHLFQQAGSEQAVAATKTMSSQMFALALLVAHWAEDEELLAGLKAVPAALQALLEDPPALPDLSAASDVWLLGRGLNESIASEIALKLKETCYLGTHAYSSAEVLHGPVAALDGDSRVIMLALADATVAPNVTTARRLLELGVKLTVMSSAEQLLELADSAVELPVTQHPVTEAFVQLLTGQLLVEQEVAARGLDADQPRHLSKVTLTV